MWLDGKTRRMYRRELAHDGYVTIDVRSVISWFRRTSYHGMLMVERRGSRRGDEHLAPVIAEAVAGSLDAVMEQLLPIAESDEVIAAVNVAAAARLGERDTAARRGVSGAN